LTLYLYKYILIRGNKQQKKKKGDFKVRKEGNFIKIKQCISLFLTVAMVAVMLPLSVPTYATSYTSDDAINWLWSKEGQAIDYDGYYGAQCVDLAMAYYKYLIGWNVGGNGCDYATNTLPSGWVRTKGGKPQKGDILVYAGGTEAGHVAIYESDYITWHQNVGGQYVRRITNKHYTDFLAYDGATYWGCIHPDFNYYVTAELSIDRASGKYNPGDTVTFYFGGENSGVYTLGIYKGSERIDTVTVNGNTYSRRFDDVAMYSAYMTAYNSSTYADSNWVSWQVNALTASLSVDKSSVAVNEPVTFTLGGNNNATYSYGVFTIGIFRDGSHVESKSISDTTYSLSYSTPGEYKAYITAYSDSNYADSNYVYWTVHPSSYKITYNANGGSGAPSAQTKVHGTSLTLSTVIPTGKSYTVRYNANGGTVYSSSKQVYKVFSSWNTKADGSGNSYESGGALDIDANATLYAQWDSATLGVCTPPTRTDYYFLGWYDSALTNSLGYPIGNHYSASAELINNITLYAMWIPTSYILFGDWNRDGEVKINDVTFANQYRLGKVTPDYDLQEFLLRCDVNRDGVVDFKDVSVINQISLNQITQADRINGYTIQTAVYAFPKKTYQYGEKISTEGLKLKVAFDAETYYIISDGLTITGYDSQKIGKQTITIYFHQFSVTYTVEVIAPRYTVSYNANGGRGAPSAQTKTHNVTLSLSNTKPTRSGYTFLGWSIVSSATTATYQPGANFTVNANTTLYAVWKKGCENNAHSYSYVATKTPSTAATGTLTGTCTKCADITAVTLPKLTTSSYNYKVTVAATCTTTGIGRYTWKTTTYGTFNFDVTIAATGHSYTSVITKTPTCTSSGVKTYTCSKCSKKYTETIAKSNHTYSPDYTVDTPATYFTAGIKSRHCLNCTASTDHTVIEPLVPPASLLKDIRKLILKGTNNTQYDYNGDGEVDIRDLVKLKKSYCGIV